MASGLRHASPSLFQQNFSKFQETKSSDASKIEKEVEYMIKDNCSGWAEKVMVMMKLRKQIVTFRDIIDLPPCDDSIPIHVLVVETVEDLHKLYPNVVCCIPIKDTGVDEGLVHLYTTLKSIGDSWAKSHKWVANFRHNADGNLEDTSLEQLAGSVLAKLNYMIKLAKEMFDVMDEDEENEEKIRDTAFGNMLTESYSDIKTTCPSPVSPTSVPPELINLHEYASVSYSQPVLLPLRLQAVEKCLSFHMFPHVSAQGLGATNKNRRAADEPNSEMREKRNIKVSPTSVTIEEPKDSEPVKDMPRTPNSNSNHIQKVGKPAAVAPTPPPPPPSNLPPPVLAPSSPSSNLASNAKAPPPPPLIPHSKGSVPVTPPIPQAKGAAPPPPPPLGATKSLRPKKASAKLKRSTHMGNLYRVLKGKVEGSNLNDKRSQGRRTQVGASAGGKQGMADALAEMTKRSAYFQQIEEDVEKHVKSITELKGAISSFQTKDMGELIKFHKYVERNLEELIDETQVLARFEGFPSKKLESLRIAAALYKRLEGIVINLENWNIEPPLSQHFDKVESYFNKIKGEIDALERSKDEESKRFQSRNIHFDFHILVRIKECMVDVSSSCMELALREQREAKAAANAELGPTTEGKRQAGIKMLWKAFQLAFRVYSFAGGQDDRADRLTKELAQEIETDPNNE